MSELGVDCQIILDGNGYFVEPGSYRVVRLRNATVIKTGGPTQAVSPPGRMFPELADPGATVAGNPVRIVDRGPNKRTWTMNVLCFNTLHRYDGSPLGDVGQQLRDQLVQSYDKVATILDFRDPSGQAWQVTFAQYAETVQDLRTQRIGLDYLVAITLIESA